MRHLPRAASAALLVTLAIAPMGASAQIVSSEVMIGQVVITKVAGSGCSTSVGDNFTLTFQPPAAGSQDVLRFSFLSGTTGATLVQTGSSTLQETFARINNTGPGSNTVSFSGYSFRRSSKFKDSGEFEIRLAFGPTCAETWRAAVTDWTGVTH
jgi:hypothetical protein